MKPILKSLLAFCLYSLASLTLANSSVDPDQLFDQGKFKEALQVYLLEYPQNSDAQNRIGYIYENEYKDEKKAVEWYRKSANQGNMSGQFNLGLMYTSGTGVIQDYKQAFQWISKAAEQGLPEAMLTLGNLYEDGHGVEKDGFKAANWYLEAAKKGNRDGQCNTAGMLMHSAAVEQDYPSAHILLEHCLKGDPNNNCCLERMAVLYSKGWGVEKDWKKAHELRTKAASNGNEVAMYMLGRDFDYGIGVQKDPKAAMEWYMKAAEKGESYAMHRLYEVYEYGKLGQKADKAKAKQWKARAEAAMKEKGESRNKLMDKMRLKMEEEE